MYRTRRILLCPLALLAAGCQDPASPPAYPAFDHQIGHYRVVNLDDSGDGSLRQAILAANATPGRNTITFDVSGAIVLLSTLPAVTDPAGLTIDGTGRAIIISGNDAVRVLQVDEGAVLVLDNVTIANGNSIAGRDGGGVLNRGELTLTRTTVSNNHATAHAGGILNHGVLTLIHSVVTGNSTGGPFGNGGGILNLGAASLTHSTVSNNSTTSDGGGILNFGMLTLAHSVVEGNSAIGQTQVVGDGGGISNHGTLVLTHSTVAGNRTNNLGGGIYSHHAAELALAYSTVSDNHAAVGGGIHGWGPLTLVQSTVSGNTAIAGGGISSRGPLTLTYSTVSNNSATNEGGGIHGGPLLLRSSIVAGNTAQFFGPDIRAAAGETTASHSLIGNPSDSGITVAVESGNLMGTAETPLDPKLGPLALNAPGTTQTHALLPGSPAIDHISQSVAGCGTESIDDQRGIRRPQGSGCDIGAFEREQAPAAPAGGIEEILAFFDAAVADGSLIGSGPGVSAANRLTALRNMLVVASDLLATDETAAACGQLQQAQRRTDGVSQPPDFVSGAAGPTLAAMIRALMAALGCS